MAKRYRAKRRETANASGLAGWLFTDLLLGLVMIFLSAVAFTAFKSKDDDPDTDPPPPGPTIYVCKEYVAGFYDDPLQLKFDTPDDAAKIKELIEAWTAKTYVIPEIIINGKKQTLSDAQAKVAVGIIYGWYQRGKKSTEGSSRALTFYSKFNESDPDNFPAAENRKVKNMRFLGTLGDFADPNGVGVELFFVHNRCNEPVPVNSTTLP